MNLNLCQHYLLISVISLFRKVGNFEWTLQPILGIAVVKNVHCIVSHGAHYAMEESNKMSHRS